MHWCLYFSSIHSFFIDFFIPVTYFIIYNYFGFSLFTTTIYLLWKYSKANTWTLFSTKIICGLSLTIFYKIFFMIALSFFISSSNLMKEAKESKSIELSIMITLGLERCVCMLFEVAFFSNTIPLTMAWTALFF